MLNLIRSDIFKLRKAKYFWILLFINILLAVGTVYLLDFTYKLAGDSMEAHLSQEQAALDESGLRQKEKALCDHGISVRLAEEQDVKRLLVSYYLRDADPESLEGVDGEKAVTAFG